MKRLAAIAALASSMVGCNMNITVDPAGRPCDPMGVCPMGYQCMAGLCEPWAGGGGAGGGGGVGGGGAGNDLCLGVVCEPLAPTCVAGTKNLRTYAGACDPTIGSCNYVQTDTPCPQGCANGQCIGDACLGMSCTAPPVPVCFDSQTRRSYATPGTCADGMCTYQPMDLHCANGCANGRCSDACTPSNCVPPAPVCQGNSLVTSTASCVSGQCMTSTTSKLCPTGCTGNACNGGPALTFTQVLPRVPFKVAAVDVKPGSLGDEVLVVGAGGNVARWNGATWSRLASGSTAGLTGVWYSSAGTAWVIGENRTVLKYNGTSLAPVSPALPTTGTVARLVDVHGTTDSNVYVADVNGLLFRWAGSAWSTITRSSGQTFALTGLWVDGAGHVRYSGRRGASGGSTGVVGYSSGGTSFSDDDDAQSTEGFTAVGPTLDTVGDFAWAGKHLNLVRRHNGALSDTYDNVGTPSLPGLGDVLRITETNSLAPTRAVYVLTSAESQGPGRLLRVSGAVASPTVDPSLEVWGTMPAMSRTESAGVVVTDANTNYPATTIVRRSAAANEALDLGEDWASVSATPLGALVVVNDFTDVATRVPLQATMQFRRGINEGATDIAAGTSTALLTTDTGKLLKLALVGASQVPTGFTPVVLPSSPSALNGVCRATDAEWYAVGTAGAAFLYNGTAASTVSTGTTTAALTDVDCPSAGAAVACGKGGVVLRLQAGAFVPVSPAFRAVDLTSCRLSGGAIYVAGDNAFGKFEAGAWTMLSARAGLGSLVVRSPNDIYAASGTSVLRFDGSAWAVVASASQSLRAGVQIGAKVVFVGNGGVAVEGQ